MCLQQFRKKTNTFIWELRRWLKMRDMKTQIKTNAAYARKYLRIWVYFPAYTFLAFSNHTFSVSPMITTMIFLECFLSTDDLACVCFLQLQTQCRQVRRKAIGPRSQEPRHFARNLQPLSRPATTERRYGRHSWSPSASMSYWSVDLTCRSRCRLNITEEHSSPSSALCYHLSWWRGSVVRTSVFGWQTFPDLHLICGWHVTTLWVKSPLWVNQPDQLSLPSLPGR